MIINDSQVGRLGGGFYYHHPFLIRCLNSKAINAVLQAVECLIPLRFTAYMQRHIIFDYDQAL